MPSAKRDMRDVLKNRVVLAERPQIVEIPGERNMPGAKIVAAGRGRCEVLRTRCGVLRARPSALSGDGVLAQYRGS